MVEVFDVVDLMTLLTERCVELFDAAAAGLPLADADGGLRVIAATDETIGTVELFQIQSDEGPCRDAFHSGGPVSTRDLADEEGRRPRFAPVAAAAGFRAAHAFRVAIEQAKGIIAERRECDMDQAFTSLRRHARSRRLRLTDVAEDVVDGTLRAEELPAPAR